MTSTGNMRFGYTILYVDDVNASVAFYERAFGLKRRFVHESGDFAELDTGATALAFSSRRLLASLGKNPFRAGKEIARANGRAHGDDVSWKADDAPHVLNSALEVATTQMLEELLASAVPAQ